MYANDKNSSTIREFVTVTVAGYEHHNGKIGFDGINNDIPCEAKPRNIRSAEPGKKRHDGGGNFTDFTYERLEKYTTQGVHLLSSGFIDGRLIFVLEFPLAHPTFVQRLKSQLDRKFAGEREPGIFLRSANFSYKDYQDAPDLKVHYLNKHLMEQYRSFFVQDFYVFLLSLSERTGERQHGETTWTRSPKETPSKFLKDSHQLPLMSV